MVFHIYQSHNLNQFKSQCSKMILHRAAASKLKPEP